MAQVVCENPVQRWHKWPGRMRVPEHFAGNLETCAGFNTQPLAVLYPSACSFLGGRRKEESILLFLPQ